MTNDILYLIIKLALTCTTITTAAFVLFITHTPGSKRKLNKKFTIVATIGLIFLSLIWCGSEMYNIVQSLHIQQGIETILLGVKDAIRSAMKNLLNLVQTYPAFSITSVVDIAAILAIIAAYLKKVPNEPEVVIEKKVITFLFIIHMSIYIVIVATSFIHPPVNNVLYPIATVFTWFMTFVMMMFIAIDILFYEKLNTPI